MKNKKYLAWLITTNTLIVEEVLDEKKYNKGIVKSEKLKLID